MQMAEENLKLKEITQQMKALSAVDNSRKYVPLNAMHKDTVEKLAEQHKKFMGELTQVSWSCYPSRLERDRI